MNAVNNELKKGRKNDETSKTTENEWKVYGLLCSLCSFHNAKRQHCWRRMHSFIPQFFVFWCDDGSIGTYRIDIDIDIDILPSNWHLIQCHCYTAPPTLCGGYSQTRESHGNEGTSYRISHSIRTRSGRIQFSLYSHFVYHSDVLFTFRRSIFMCPCWRGTLRIPI